MTETGFAVKKLEDTLNWLDSQTPIRIFYTAFSGQVIITTNSERDIRGELQSGNFFSGPGDLMSLEFRGLRISVPPIDNHRPYQFRVGRDFHELDPSANAELVTHVRDTLMRYRHFVRNTEIKSGLLKPAYDLYGAVKSVVASVL